MKEDRPSGVHRRTFIGAAVAAAAVAAVGIDGIIASPASATLGPWGGYSNGQIPLSALSLVNYPGVSPFSFPGSLPAVYLKPDAAAGLLAMLQAYHAQKGGYLGVNEGYRTYAGQQYWWDHHNHNPALAAVPGTSNHGYGVAFDLESPTDDQILWVAANGPNYGYTPIKSEDWHFDFSGTFAYQPSTPNTGVEEDMGRLVRHPNGSVAFAATDGTFTVLNTMDEVNALVATAAAPAEMINLPDGFIWDLRIQVAQKRKVQNEV